MAALTTLANVKSWLGLADSAVTAITKANPGVATCVSHPLRTGQQIVLSGVAGMTALNGVTLTVTVLTTDTFSIGVNTSSYPTYTSGGLFNPDDIDLTRLLNSFSAVFERETRRTIAETDYVYRCDGNGKSELFLPEYPITEVASVIIDGTAIDAAEENEDTGEYSEGWYLEDNVLYLEGYTFPRGSRNVRVAYSAGYGTVPDDIQQCIISMVAYQYRGKGHIGLRSEASSEKTTYFQVDEWPADVLACMDRYRKVLVA